MIPKTEPVKKLLQISGENVTETGSDAFAATLCAFLDELDRQEISESIEAHATVEHDKDMEPFCTVDQELLQEFKTQYAAIEGYYMEVEKVPPQGFLDMYYVGNFKPYRKGEQGRDLGNLAMHGLSYMLSDLMHIEVKKSRPEIAALIARLAIVKDGQIMGFRDNSIEGLKRAYLEIHSFVTEKKIMTHRLYEHLQQFCKQDAVESETDKRLLQNAALASALMILLQGDLNSAHHLSFVQRFARLDDKTGQIIALKISPIANKWQNEKERIVRVQFSRFWYGWYRLKYFQSVFKNFENLRVDALEKKDFRLELQLCNDFKAIQEIGDGKQPKYEAALRGYQKKVSCYIEQMPISSDNQSTPSVEVPQSEAAQTGMKPLITAARLCFNEHNGEIRHGKEVLIVIDTDDVELIRFTSAFFPGGQLSDTRLSLKKIQHCLAPKEESLIPVKQDFSSSTVKEMGSYEYNHVRYLKNKLNKLMGPHIDEFIILKLKKYYPSPDIFKSVF